MFIFQFIKKIIAYLIWSIINNYTDLCKCNANEFLA